ncbi:unnamed protein product [Microthlaspi erraticum]|uniref:Uncharacterized protein n=1 Tax=Microthlaspi erraticum TaxID=1685480 RepID=A0A6D2JRP5_9BRAS|nr:unnamed protein product [Microthlaspi erraticum]
MEIVAGIVLETAGGGVYAFLTGGLSERRLETADIANPVCEAVWDGGIGDPFCFGTCISGGSFIVRVIAYTQKTWRLESGEPMHAENSYIRARVSSRSR